MPLSVLLFVSDMRWWTGCLWCQCVMVSCISLHHFGNWHETACTVTFRWITDVLAVLFKRRQISYMLWLAVWRLFNVCALGLITYMGINLQSRIIKGLDGFWCYEHSATYTGLVLMYCPVQWVTNVYLGGNIHSCCIDKKWYTSWCIPWNRE